MMGPTKRRTFEEIEAEEDEDGRWLNEDEDRDGDPPTDEQVEAEWEESSEADDYE